MVKNLEDILLWHGTQMVHFMLTTQENLLFFLSQTITSLNSMVRVAITYLGIHLTVQHSAVGMIYTFQMDATKIQVLKQIFATTIVMVVTQRGTAIHTSCLWDPKALNSLLRSMKFGKLSFD